MGLKSNRGWQAWPPENTFPRGENCVQIDRELSSEVRRVCLEIRILPPPCVAMMYFIPWALLLAFVILAVPIASWLDSRKMKAAYRSTHDSLGDSGFDDEDDEAFEGEAMDAEGGGEDVLDEAGDFGGEGDFGGDDFSAFEEVR